MKRTILRSLKGKKLYAKRRADGRFSDIQSYKRAHAADLRRTAKGEKRQRLIGYISAFVVRIGWWGTKDVYNRAWDKLWRKVDSLKLFE